MQTTRRETAQLGSTGLEMSHDHFGGDDYNLHLLIDRMERMDRSERDIELAVREASGWPSHSTGPRSTERRRAPFRVIGRRLQVRGRLWNREEG